MIGAIVCQLTRNLSMEQIHKAGFDAYFVDHTTGVYPQSAGGTPWSATGMQSKGDVITDLHEDMAAEGTITNTQRNASKSSKVLKNKDFLGKISCTSLIPYKK